MTALLWYVFAFAAYVFGARSVSCPRGFYVDGSFADGSFVCAQTPPAWVCPGPQGCDDDAPDPKLFGALRCAAGERALTDLDGRGAHCGGES